LENKVFDIIGARCNHEVHKNIFDVTFIVFI